jgi:hypothetical protein
MEAPAHMSRSSSSASLHTSSSSYTTNLINMLTSYYDITHEIFVYLPVVDILHSRECCRYLNIALSSIWKRLVWRDVVPVHFLEEIHSSTFFSMGEEAFFMQIAYILEADRSADIYFELYKVLYRFKKPLLGYYRRTSFNLKELRGALDVMYISSQRLVYQTYIINNNCLVSYESIPWKVKDSVLVNEERQCELGGPVEFLRGPMIKGNRAAIPDLYIRFDIQFRKSCHDKLDPHIISSSSLKPLSPATVDLFQSCLGLVKGMYGKQAAPQSLFDSF